MVERLILSIHIYNAIVLVLVLIHIARRCHRSHTEIGLGVARVEPRGLWFSSPLLGLFMSSLVMRLAARCQVDVSRLLEVAQWLIDSSIVAVASGLLAFSSFFVMIASRVLPGKPIGLVWSGIWL